MNNKSPADTRMQTSAILAISSLDRYTRADGNNQSQLFAIPLIQQYNNSGQPCNNFTITSGGALIYGYIKKIQVAQTQLQYNIPTVNVNNCILQIDSYTNNLPTGQLSIAIPFGFYTPAELAAQVELLIVSYHTPPFDVGFTVTYDPLTGFSFSTNNLIYKIKFRDINAYLAAGIFPVSDANNFIRAYKLFGFDVQNCVEPPNFTQISTNIPQMLYTSYIDIISQTLTKYQKVKDTDSSAQKQADIISRIYLAGTGNPQPTAGDANVYPLGSRPFTVVQDMNYCKTMRWSKDEAINSIDFQLKDQYGDLIFQGIVQDNIQDEFYYTEFQMTLLCIEEQD